MTVTSLDDVARESYEREINRRFGGGTAYWPTLPESEKNKYRKRVRK